jgi:hypothetical protein
MPMNFLRDVTKHTQPLGCINLIKITGTETETVVETVGDNQIVIVKAVAKKPQKMFVGQFGLPNLDKLVAILGIDEYKEDAKLTILTETKGEVTNPSGIKFENKIGDFKNEYRFMTADLVNSKLPTIAFKGAKWNVEFAPSVVHIQRMKYMMQSNGEEATFCARTEDDKLKFFFGDPSSHAGEFVFTDNVSGSLVKKYNWPTAVFNSILNLSGDKVIKFSDDGVAQITVDSGLVEYTYLMPAQQK